MLTKYQILGKYWVPDETYRFIQHLAPSIPKKSPLTPEAEN